MAVYRSDQAQLTFGVEAAPGGYPEIAITSSMTGALLTTAAYSAGTTALTLTSSPGTSYIGAVVCIGTSSGAAARSSRYPRAPSRPLRPWCRRPRRRRRLLFRGSRTAGTGPTRASLALITRCAA